MMTTTVASTTQATRRSSGEKLTAVIDWPLSPATRHERHGERTGLRHRLGTLLAHTFSHLDRDWHLRHVSHSSLG